MSNASSLFGIKYSNHDFGKKKSWGKNIFNSTFPASLSSYLDSKGLAFKYIKYDNQKLTRTKVVDAFSMDLFGMELKSDEVLYGFEKVYLPYRQYAEVSIPRVDLVLAHHAESVNDDRHIGLEIKLTAIPDSTTRLKNDADFGSELVVRPPTISYLAYSIADSWSARKTDLLKLTSYINGLIDDWTNENKVVPYLSEIIKTLDEIIEQTDNEKPILLHPIWKTEADKAVLHEDCLDVFVWSNLAFSQLFINASRNQKSMTRQVRTSIWLLKMLHDFARDGKINHKFITDNYTYNVKNDKAFAVSGTQTNEYMKCKELTKPRIKKKEIKNMIIGGGERMLSPERRFDAFVVNDSEIFD